MKEQIWECGVCKRGHCDGGVEMGTLDGPWPPFWNGHLCLPNIIIPASLLQELIK